MKLRYSGWLALALFSLFLAGCKSGGQHLIINSDGGSVDVQVEVARSEAQRRNGLMGRTELPDGNGMLFVYSPDARPSMWMKNMLIPLDFVFIGNDLKINYIENSAPPCNSSEDKNCAQYSSPNGSVLVLELPAGFTKKHEIGPGNRVELVGIDGF
jgi:uncharacterized protein